MGQKRIYMKKLFINKRIKYNKICFGGYCLSSGDCPFGKYD